MGEAGQDDCVGKAGSRLCEAVFRQNAEPGTQLQDGVGIVDYQGKLSVSDEVTAEHITMN